MAAEHCTPAQKDPIWCTAIRLRVVILNVYDFNKLVIAKVSISNYRTG